MEDSQSGTLIISTTNVAAVEDASTSQLMLLPTDDATNSLLYDVTPFEHHHLVDNAAATIVDNSTTSTSKTDQYETRCDKNVFPVYKAKSEKLARDAKVRIIIVFFLGNQYVF